MMILGIHMRRLDKTSAMVLTKFSRVIFSLTMYLIFFLCGEAEMTTGCFIHSVATMSERVALDAVAVRAMMFTSEGKSALTTPSCLYSGRNDSPRLSHIRERRAAESTKERERGQAKTDETPNGCIPTQWPLARPKQCLAFVCIILGVCSIMIAQCKTSHTNHVIIHFQWTMRTIPKVGTAVNHFHLVCLSRCVGRQKRKGEEKRVRGGWRERRVVEWAVDLL